MFQSHSRYSIHILGVQTRFVSIWICLDLPLQCPVVQTPNILQCIPQMSFQCSGIFPTYLFVMPASGPKFLTSL